MKKHASAVVMAALSAVIFSAGFLAPASADARRFRAFVYPDRTRPELSVVVDDFRINETLWEAGGLQYVWVHGPLGNFQVPFSRIRQVEFLKFIGPNVAKIDWAWYEVHISGVNENEAYDGQLEVRVMRGIASEGVPWYLYPMTEMDRGRKLWRIVFGEERVPPTTPWEAPKQVEAPIAVVTPQAAPPPALPTEDDLFARALAGRPEQAGAARGRLLRLRQVRSAARRRVGAPAQRGLAEAMADRHRADRGHRRPAGHQRVQHDAGPSTCRRRA